VCYKAVVSQLPGRADVVIIGAGFAGLATAWTLQRRGVNGVIVLEREVTLGRFASGRSAGLGRQLAEDDATTVLTVRGVQLLREAPVWMETGGILSFDTIARAEEYQTRAAKFAVAIEPIELAKKWPQLAGLRSATAFHVPSDGAIDVMGLLRMFSTGVRIAMGVGAARVEKGKVTTAVGAIEARVIVDASGPWAGQLVGDPELECFKRHVFVVESDVKQGTPWLWHLGDGEMYLRPDGDGVLASPCDSARSEPGHQDPDLVGEAHLRKLFDAADTELASAPITRRWACQRAFAPDRKMRLGRDPDRPWLVWAAALGGHGATASAAIGERVAEAVVAALG
jgi:glycine/D-amino acid oxidase-like deaminating enzyme